ncbi:MAG: hypothetical protein HFJ80_00770 [Clostridiales bacterium]|nr:hypothetical protein [Clostridiales bacterium]
MKRMKIARAGLLLLTALTLAAGTPVSADDMHEVRLPESAVVVPPTLVTRVTGAAVLDALADRSPASAVLSVTDDGRITAGDGADVGDFAQACQRLGAGVIPAFEVKTEAAAEQLGALLKTAKPAEAFVLSDSVECIQQVRQAYTYVRGVLDRTFLAETDENSADRLLDIRRQVNTSGSKIVILPAHMADRDTVETLQKWLLTVWVEADAASLTRTEAARLITSGANGIVSPDRARMEELLAELPEKTMVRRPFIIGHRGDVTQAPENTLESAKIAVQNGADAVELDIHLTADGELVVIHDEDVKRTTDGSGSVEKMTMEQVKQLVANKSFSNPSLFPDIRIPTLREYFEEFRGTGVQLFVEIKSEQTQLVPKFIELIEEYGMEGQVSVISFSAAQLQKLHRQLPGMTTGLLFSNQISADIPLDSVQQIMKATEPLSSTVNHNFGGINAAFVKTAADRGITLWPWTYSQEILFKTHYSWGLGGLTTDSAEFASDMVTSLEAAVKNGKPDSISLQAGQTVPWNLYAVKQAGEKQEVTDKASFLMLDGDGVISLTSNGVLKAEKEGTASFLLLYDVYAGKGVTYQLATAPITVTVEKGFPAAAAAAIGGGAVLAVAAVVLVLLLKRKKRAG